jgi:hypothetical protein
MKTSAAASGREKGLCLIAKILHEQAGKDQLAPGAHRSCLRAVLWFAAFAIAGIRVLLGAIMALNVHPLTALFDCSFG